MPSPPVRSRSIAALHEESFAVPAQLTARDARVGRSRRRAPRSGAASLHLAVEVTLGLAVAVIPALVGLGLGTAALAAIMGSLIAVTAVASPTGELPVRASRLHDRLGMDCLLVGLAALLWVFGQGGASLIIAATCAHLALTLAPGRMRIRA